MGKMIFKILICISVMLIGAGAFGKTKIALIGDSKETTQVADMVLAKMADNDNLDFLERKEIDKITAEHKLSNWSHGASEIIRLGKLLKVDIFAVLRSENKKYFFVVFNAKSAVRLIDQQLTGDSAETLAADMTTVLKQSLPKLQKKNSLCKITLFSIRNVELPRNRDVSCNRIAAELVRKIGQLPDFAVIEGRYIGLINKERELTQLASSISQASFLLNIDFYLSGIKDKTLVKLEIKVPGQKSKHFTMECNLKTLQIPPEKINKITNYMRQEKQKSNISQKDEAARYYYEFKELYKKRKIIECLPKLEAAIAYDNSNRKYQKALLSTISQYATGEYSDKTNKRSATEKINRYFDRIERWDRLLLQDKGVPDVFNAHHLYLGIGHSPLASSMSGFDPLNGNHWTVPDFPEATLKRIADHHLRYVKHTHIIYHFKHWMNPDVKLTSRRNMFNFSRDLTAMMNMYYPSQNEYLAQSLPLIRLYLKKTSQADEHITDKNINGRVLSWSLWNRFFVCFKNFPVNSPQFIELEKTARIATTHPWAFVRLYAVFALYLAESKKNPSQIEKALSKFLNNMTIVFKSLPAQKNTDSLINLYAVTNGIARGGLSWVHIPNHFAFLKQITSKLFNIMKQRHEVYFPLLNAMSWNIHNKQRYESVKKLSVYLNSEIWKMIGREHILSKVKFVNEKISRRLVEYLNKNQERREIQKNQPFSVTKLLSFKYRAVNAAISDSGRYIYWNCFNNKKNEVYRYDTVSKQQTQIGKSISVNRRIQYNYLAIGENYLAISIEWSKLVIVYNLKTGKIIKLTTPFAQPKHIAIVNNSLLIWCAKDNNLLEYKLPSLTYKVVYSANRRHVSSDPFSNQTVCFDTMFSDQKRKRVVILLSGYNLKRPGWWYYYPEKQKFEYVGTYPLYHHPRWTKITQDKILLPSPNYCFILDLQNNTKELLFYTLYSNGTNAKVQRMKEGFERYHGVKARVTLNNLSSHQKLAAGTIAGNYFWSNHPWYRIDLTTGKRTFYPASDELNSYALILRTINDKTLLLVNAKGIFKLHLTSSETKKQKNNSVIKKEKREER